MEKSDIMNALNERLKALEEWRGERKEPEDKKKNAKKPIVDEEVCPVCAADLLFVEEGIVFCPKCDLYFEYKEEE